MKRNAILVSTALMLASCSELLGLDDDPQLGSRKEDAGSGDSTAVPLSDTSMSSSDTVSSVPSVTLSGFSETTADPTSETEEGSSETTSSDAQPTSTSGFVGVTSGDSSSSDATTGNGSAPSTESGSSETSEGTTRPDSGVDTTSHEDSGATSTASTATSTGTSTLEPCGNGALEEGEGCDDSNRQSLDGCSASCKPEDGWRLQVNGLLTPAFDPATTDYTVRLPLGPERVQLEVGAPLGAIVTVNDVLVTSEGKWSSDILPWGVTSLALEVNDGTVSKVFELNVERAEPEQRYFKASNAASGDLFGRGLALSADGNTLVVGAPQEDSSGVPPSGSEPDDAAAEAGAVYVFTRDESGQWVQRMFLKAHMPGAGDLFGYSVAVSATGERIAVGAPGESDGGRNVRNTETTTNTAPSSGASYMFERNSSGVWVQKAFFKASNSREGTTFGHRVALNAAGDTLAVTADAEGGSVGGVGSGEGTDTLVPGSGAAYVFVRGASGAWTQQAYIKASNPGEIDFFGESLALSGDGSTLAVGAYWEDSSSSGVTPGTTGGAGGDDDTNNSGAVYLYRRAGTTWAQQAFFKASNPGSDDEYGKSVALNFDGSVLAIGAHKEDGGTSGVSEATAFNDEAPNAGAVYLYERSSDAWTSVAYVKALNPDNNDHFGCSVALSDDGTMLAVGAYQEDGNGTSLSDGLVTDDGSYDSGAVYLFQNTESWWQRGYAKALNNGESDFFGWRVDLDAAGTRMAVSAPSEQSNESGLSANPNSNAATLVGAAYLFE